MYNGSDGGSNMNGWMAAGPWCGPQSCGLETPSSHNLTKGGLELWTTESGAHIHTSGRDLANGGGGHTIRSD